MTPISITAFNNWKSNQHLVDASSCRKTISLDPKNQDGGLQGNGFSSLFLASTQNKSCATFFYFFNGMSYLSIKWLRHRSYVKWPSFARDWRKWYKYIHSCSFVCDMIWKCVHRNTRRGFFLNGHPACCVRLGSTLEVLCPGETQHC